MDKPSESHLVHGRRVRPEGPSPVDVITVQSQLVYGHAGNSAAVPPLRALGLRVAEVPTTLLSNAPFYSTLRGRMLPADWLAELLQGASERGLPERARALVSGYFGTVDNGQVFAQWARRVLADNRQLEYWLDPVIGDTHTGPYVEPALEAVFREQLLPLATVVTPNAFELGRLTGRDALAQDDAIAAARELLQRGPRWVIAHSVQGEPGQLVTLAVSADAVWRWSSEHLPVDVAAPVMCCWPWPWPLSCVASRCRWRSAVPLPACMRRWKPPWPPAWRSLMCFPRRRQPSCRPGASAASGWHEQCRAAGNRYRWQRRRLWPLVAAVFQPVHGFDGHRP
jgi:Pyridoxal/pyridoxine/pyridoxamine kinase